VASRLLSWHANKWELCWIELYSYFVCVCFVLSFTSAKFVSVLWAVKLANKSAHISNRRGFSQSYFTIFYLKLLIIFFHNPDVLVLRSSQLLNSLCISLHFCFRLFTFSASMYFLSPVLACNLSLVFILRLSLMWLPASTLCSVYNWHCTSWFGT
jgi:hypothetical protein